MCGGIVASFGRIPKDELAKIYSEQEIEQFEKNGEFESSFRDKRPVLPIFEGEDVKLIDWGNREDKAPFPVTGWARQESLLQHKWDNWKPKRVTILANEGVEKGKSFEVKGDLKGILIEQDGDKRVYMITEAADNKYKKYTKHDRMPVGNLSL